MKTKFHRKPPDIKGLSKSNLVCACGRGVNHCHQRILSNCFELWCLCTHLLKSHLKKASYKQGLGNHCDHDHHNHRNDHCDHEIDHDHEGIHLTLVEASAEQADVGEMH